MTPRKCRRTGYPGCDITVAVSSSRRSNQKRAKAIGERPIGWWVAYRSLQPAILILCVAVIAVYARVVGAGFVGLDDDIHVYANPFLNPPSLDSVAKLWQHQYQGLYIPLAYTILAAIAVLARVPAETVRSIGHTVSLSPLAFHSCSVGIHLANALLCFFLVRRLTRKSSASLFCAILFALHPLQVESVGWISELRGLTSSCFALLALNGLALSRGIDQVPPKSRRLFLASTVSVICAMLCKPTAVVLPFVAIAIDRVVFETPWRKALLTASVWAASVFPIALATRSIQVVSLEGQSPWWQRPFIAADALAFYVRKAIVPIDLCVDYGRTPRVAMAHATSYVVWAIPVSLLLLGYWLRRRRPITWLGALLFALFLLPTLGLIPFSFQAYSTVADRYAYLAMIGIGLIVADATEHTKLPRVAARVASLVLIVFAILSFNQSRYWGDNGDFLQRTIELNPGASFAYDNLGYRDFANGDYSAALAQFQACIQRDPNHVSAYINMAEAYAALNKPQEAEDAIQKALSKSRMEADDLSNLGLVLMRMNQYPRAVDVLKKAVALDPSNPRYLFNEANALATNDELDEAEVAYRQCITLAPTHSSAHTALGIVLAETNRLQDAIVEFGEALRLQPNDEVALDSLRKAQDLLAGRGQ
jgi:protein O-mannosyl-transferase